MSVKAVVQDKREALKEQLDSLATEIGDKRREIKEHARQLVRVMQQVCRYTPSCCLRTVPSDNLVISTNLLVQNARRQRNDLVRLASCILHEVFMHIAPRYFCNPFYVELLLRHMKTCYCINYFSSIDYGHWIQQQSLLLNTLAILTIYIPPIITWFSFRIMCLSH